MRKKIKIMNPSPQISDEEIDRYMNFDELLRKQALASSATKWWKWSWIPAVVIVSVVWYFIPEREVQTSHTPTPQTSEAVVPAEGDSLTIKPIETLQPFVQVPPSKSPSKSTPPVDLVKEAPKQKNDKFQPDTYVQAEPIEGYDALYAYLNSNIRYPIESMKDSLQGVVTVSFIVGKEGFPSRVEASSTMDDAFKREAIRIIEEMPKWKPATLNGTPITSKISLPITFQIQKIKTR
jgi:TonB family protein